MHNDLKEHKAYKLNRFKCIQWSSAHETFAFYIAALPKKKNKLT